MAAQYYKINYKSDFVLTVNSDAGWAVPFCIKFWTGMPSQAYFAGFDGENYVNCRVGETPTQLLVMFDDHHMPIGELKMQIAYHTTIEDFPDRQFDEVTNPTNVTVDIDGTEYQVMLDFTGESGAEIDFSMPSSGVMSVNGKIGYVTLNAEDVGAQPTIEDLAAIRSGAAAGATAVQPAALQEGLAGKQDTISDLSTIRSGAAAGATAYQKPGTGIPKTDLASSVQSSLNKADAAAPQSSTYTKSEVNELVEEAVSHQTMIVTISSDGNYTADKTFTEIKAFIDNGGTVIAKDEEDGDSYYYLDNYIASEVVFTRNIWGSGGFSTRYYTIDNTNTVSFIDSVHFISSDVNSSSTANLANSAAVKMVNDKVATKQDTISDLSTIRSGAAAGATAVQPAAMNTALAAKEDKSNKVTSFSSPTDTQYPSAKLVSDQLATKQGTISDLSTIRSGAAAGATAVQPAAFQEGLAGKQDTISDLSTIRSGASAGATAVQPAALESGLAEKQDTISDLATIRSGAAAGATAVQPAAFQEGLAGKQDTISDLSTIRSGASAGATAVQPAALESGLAEKQDTISDLATIRSGAAAGATAVQPAAMNTALAAKQDMLTFDNAPTANSNNPVKSSGIKTALDAKQTTISTVDVTVDNNTGTPSGSASVSGSTLSLSFQNLKGATGATGATGPQGPQGERGLPGESGVTGDVSGFTVIQTIDPSATYGATDIAGAATVQATNQELTELAGIDLTNAHITRRPKYIGTDNKWKTGGYHTMFYINGWDYVKITSNSSNAANAYLLTNAGTTGTASMATGSTRYSIAAGQSQTIPIQDDANYLYIVLGATTDYEQKPSSIELMKSIIPEIDEKIDKYVETIYTIDNMTVQGLLNPSGGITSNTNTQGYRTSDYVSVDASTTLEFYNLFPNQTNPTYQGLVLYNSANEVVATPQYSELINHGIIDFANYPSVTKVRFSSSSAVSYGNGTKCIFKKELDLKLLQNASEEIDGIINGSYIARNYGCTISGSYYNPQDILYMSSNTPCLKGGYVSNISGYFKAAGTLNIAVGFLDQNGYLIVESEHSITVPSQDYNSIDVENLGIYMSKDDYLFAKVEGDCFPKYGVDSSAVTGLSVRGFEYPATIRTDGVYFCFAWTVKTSTEGYEDLNEKVTDNEKKIETLQDSVSELANGNIITDKVTGIPYEITIRNGQIVLVPNQYSNVLVIGNSITKHGEAAIWPASDRGMAATKPEYDFCGIMQTQMRLKDNTTTVTRLNAAVWEGNLSYSLSTLLDGYMTSTTDLVVIRLGENVSNTSGFEAALNSMIAYIYTVNPNVRILITSMFWANEAKDTALKNAATTNGLTYVKISQYGDSAYQEATGHYTYNTDFTAISEITNSAVARHPSNRGMCAIANEILGALGYERSSNTYSLQSVTVGGVTGNMYVLNQ